VLMEILEEPKRKSFWSFFSKEDKEQLTLETMLARLKQEREILSALGVRITDYLNWYQLEQPENHDGEFGDYLQLKEDLENAPSSDGGYLSQYLDDMERLYKTE